MLIALIIVGVVIVVVIAMYNGLVRLKVQCDNAWSDIDVQLKRRYDLIPNLVETVKGYAGHEKETLEGVIAARNQAISATGPAAKAGAENMLTGALRQVFAADAEPTGRQHPERAPLLQRRGSRFQHKDCSVPVKPAGRHVWIQASRIFRNQRTGRTRSSQGQLWQRGRRVLTHLRCSRIDFSPPA
jgi:hypothetical protein